MALDSQTIPDGPIWVRESVTNRTLVLGKHLVPSGATSKQVPETNCSLILGEASGHFWGHFLVIFGVIFWTTFWSLFGPLLGAILGLMALV